MTVPRVIAHRGASGAERENSLAAFRKAVELGSDGVELDIHATADGALLVHHDPAVQGIGLIRDLPHSAFSEYKLSNGEPIPTLAQALDLLDKQDIWVEVKALHPEWDGHLLGCLDAAPKDACCGVHSFDHRIIARLGEQRPDLRRGVLLSSYLLDNSQILNAVGADTLWMETSLIDEELVQDLHEDGRDVIAWTANDEREIRRLIALGVDGICGNYPDLIRSLLHAST
ncbi:MAG TPA: glycerophosphodiester phosphodiesterase [Gemmatimonadales bacterium]|nr:glycerophosphodiester phosphodiesterase [Gemmatimonadales bacterium]